MSSSDEALRGLRVEVTTTHTTAATVVAAVGELDLATAPVLEQALRTVGAPAVLVVDLTGVTFLGSAALSVLITAHAATPLRLAGLTRAARRVLRVTGLDAYLAVYDTVEAATVGRA